MTFPFAQFSPAAATVTPPATDPYWDYVLFQTGMEQANAYQGSFIDDTGMWTIGPTGGTSAISSTIKEYGATSGFNGSSGEGWLTAASTAWFLSLSNSDAYTFEFSIYFPAGVAFIVDAFGIFTGGTGIPLWIRPSNASGSNGLIRLLGSHPPTGGFTFDFSTPAGTLGVTASWYKICVEKNTSGKIRVYINGVMQSSNTPADSGMFVEAGAKVYLGSSAGNIFQNGYQDNWRITKGLARYNSDAGYTPATAAFPIGAAHTVVFVGSSRGATAANVFTYTAATLNTNATDVVVVGVSNESIVGSSTTSVTLAGTKMVPWVPGAILNTSSNRGYLNFFYLVPGVTTTANLVSTTVSVSNVDMYVWVLRGVGATPIDEVTVTQATSATTPLDNIETYANGAVCFMGLSRPGSGTYTESWTGTETVIEDYDGNSSLATSQIVAGHIGQTTASATNDLTLTLTASEDRIGAAIAFGPAVNDPYWGHVGLLLDMQGANGGTTFTDLSRFARTLTAGGSSTTTAQFKFGTSSAVFDGSNDFLNVASISGIGMDLEDTFTEEGWFRFNSTAGDQVLFTNGASPGSSGAFLRYTGGSLDWFNWSTAGPFSNAWSPSTGVWYHIAICRAGGVTRMFIDGVAGATTSAVTQAFSNAGGFFGIGGQGIASRPFNGWCGGFRFTRSSGRYPSNFTPPAAAFPTS